MPHLHAVADPPVDYAPEQRRLAALAATNAADEAVTAAVVAITVAEGDLDGTDLVALQTRLTEIASAATEGRRIVNRLGHDWIVRVGKRGRATIDGVVYRASITGSSTSLKVADKARLTDAFFRDKLAPWLAAQLGSEKPGDDVDTTARMWLTLVVQKLTAVASVDFKATPLREQWDLDPDAYASPSTGAGPTPTFEKAPTPKETTT